LTASSAASTLRPAWPGVPASTELAFAIATVPMAASAVIVASAREPLAHTIADSTDTSALSKPVPSGRKIASVKASRFVVIDRLVTQGTCGEKGRRWCERIWTVIATCVQQGRSVFNFLSREEWRPD